MPEPKNAAPPTAKQRRLRWLGRWLLKLGGWFLALSVVVALIGTVVAWFAWRNLTGLANMAAARFVAPYRVQLGKVDVSKRGEVHVETVRLLPPLEMADEDDAPWVHLDGIDLTYDLDELRNERRFRTVTLRGPVIRIDDASLETFAGGGTDEEGSTVEIVTPDLGFLGRLAERIEVTGGELEIDTSKAPRLEAEWELSVPPIDFADEEWINREPLSLRLSEVAIGEEGKLGSIERLDLSARVRSDLGGLEIGEFSLVKPELRISPVWFPGDASETAEATTEPETGSNASEPAAAPGSSGQPGIGKAAFEILLGALRLSEARISVGGFDSGVPDLAFDTSLDWRDLRVAGGEISSSAPLEWRAENLVIDGHAAGASGGGNVPTARIGRLELRFDLRDLLERQRIETVELFEPSLFLTPESIARFGGGDDAESGSKTGRDSDPGAVAVDSSKMDQPAAWELGNLTIRDGSLEAADWQWGDSRPIPAVRFEWEAEWRDLSPDLFRSSGDASERDPTQRVVLRDLQIGELESLRNHQAGDRLLGKVERVATEFRLGELLRHHHLDTLRVERPLLDITDEQLPEWIGELAASGQAEIETKVPPTRKDRDGSEAGAEDTFTAGELMIEDGVLRLDTEAFGGRVPKVQGRFSLETVESAGESADALFRLAFGELRVRSQQGAAMPGTANQEGGRERESTEALGGLFPQDPDPQETTESTEMAGRSGAIRERDVAYVRELKVDFTAEGLQRSRRVERVEIKGGEFQVGEGLQQMIDGEGEGDAEPKDSGKPQEDSPREGEQAAAPAAPDLDRTGEWTVGQFIVTESQVRFEALIPQIEGLEFAIETRLEEIPLSHGGLLSQEKMQKVEIAGIEIRDPYDSFITVAFLPTIFVEFSFAGLVNQRIDKIELISPSIYVGQGLFWWIDYQRNYRKQNEGAGFGVDGAGGEVADANPEEAGVDWEIREINAHFGKIVIAPTGRPIGIVPFPFNASTNMEKGEIALKLQIPREQQYVYQFPDLQLDLFGLEGDIEFNVPIKQEDNNLVQTFKLERAVWKQYQAEDLYLTVTYDTNGIYGRFGGKAYQGYAEGEFNVYLDDVGRWDAWLAGTTFDMGPVTKVVAPDSFIMDGEVNAKLVSEGKGLVFGETWGEIETLTPGRIDFTKLNEVIEDLPEEWSLLQKSATKLSLETLKQFDYQSGRGDLYFLNQDGWLRLDLEGEHGSRTLELYAHDWRGDSREIAGRTEDKPDASEADEGVVKPAAVPDGPRRERRQTGPRKR